MLYVSHPVADLFKEAVKPKIDELNEIQRGGYEFGGKDYTRGDDTSFAFYYFHNPEGELNITKEIYYYACMGEMYATTLCETLNSRKVKIYVF
jgi:hypothetical protein